MQEEKNFDFLYNKTSNLIEGVALKNLPGFKVWVDIKKEAIELGKHWSKGALSELKRCASTAKVNKLPINVIKGFLYVGMYRYGMVQMVLSGM